MEGRAQSTIFQTFVSMLPEFTASRSTRISNEKKFKVFTEAIDTVNYEKIRDYLDEGFDINEYLEGSVAPLHVAAERGLVSLGKLLLEYENIKVNLRSSHSYTPLYLAVQCRQIDFVEFLLKSKVDPNVTDRFGYTPLRIAVRLNSMPMVKLLLEHKADPNILGFYGNSALVDAVISINSFEMVETLLKYNADVNAASTNMPLLLQAALNCHTLNDIAIIDLMLKNGGTINAYSKDKRNAAHIAAITGYVPLAKLLIKYDVDVQACDIINRTPIIVAIEHDNLEMAWMFEVKHLRTIHRTDNDVDIYEQALINICARLM